MTAAKEVEVRTPDPQRAFYEFEAETYHVSAESEPAYLHRRDLVLRLLPKEPINRILDVGCADGALAMEMRARTSARVVGAELAWARVLRASKKQSSLPMVQGSIYSLPFADGEFPLVTCTDLLEHLDDPSKAMRELTRVSSKHVLITVPFCINIEKTLCTHCGHEYFLYGHQHSFGKEGIEKLARECGAEVARFEHLIPMFECRRYRWFPPLKWLIWDHFKNSGTLGALISKR